MPSTYSPSLRLELIGAGEQAGSWGNTTNTNLGTLVEQAIAGYTTISMLDTNYTLSTANGASDESRSMAINVTSSVSLTATRNVICPAVTKLYVIKNATAGGQSIIIKTSPGVGVTVANGSTAIVFCNGTDVFSASTSAPTGVSSVTAGTGIGTTASTGAITISNTGVTSLTTSSGLSTNTSATGAVSVTNTGVTGVTAGTGIGTTASTGSITVSNTGVTSLTTSSGLSTNTSATGAVSVTNTGVTGITAGTGIGATASTGSITLSNSGVTSITTSTGLSTNTSATGAVTITNTGVRQITAGAGISVDVTTGNVTITNTGGGGGGGSVTAVTATAPVASTGGSAPVISMAAATSGNNGYMTSAYASKLDGIAAGATNVTNTNQLTNGSGFLTGISATAPVTSTGGAAPTIGIPAATSTAAGHMTAAYAAKLDGIGAGAAVVSVTATTPVASTGGTNPVISMAAATSSNNGYMTSTYAAKLDGIAAGATNVTNTDQLTNGAGFVTSSGSVAYATTAGTASTVTVTDSNAASTYRMVWNSGTSLYNTDGIYCNPNADYVYATDFIANSDERLKKDWGALSDEFLSKLADVKSGTYTKISSGLRQVGVTAQSLQPVLPEAVHEDDDGYLSVSYGNAALVACIELAKEVQRLRARLEVLEGTA